MFDKMFDKKFEFEELRLEIQLIIHQNKTRQTVSWTVLLVKNNCLLLKMLHCVEKLVKIFSVQFKNYFIVNLIAHNTYQEYDTTCK